MNKKFILYILSIVLLFTFIVILKSDKEHNDNNPTTEVNQKSQEKYRQTVKFLQKVNRSDKNYTNSDIDAVESINISSSDISNYELDKLHNLPNLKELNFTGSRLNEQALEGIRNLDITKLVLNGLKLDDQSISHIKYLNNLNEIYLVSSKLSNESLNHISNINNLEILYLNRTMIDDTSVKYLKKMKSLKKLNITHTKISKTFADELRNHLPSTKIYY